MQRECREILEKYWKIFFFLWLFVVRTDYDILITCIWSHGVKKLNQIFYKTLCICMEGFSVIDRGCCVDWMKAAGGFQSQGLKLGAFQILDHSARQLSSKY